PVVLLALVAREASSLSLGQFNVSRSTQLLTDHSRQDPFASTSQPRDVLISIFRPASNTCTTYAPTPYMPLKTAQFEDATLGAAYGLPAGTITNLTLDLATCNTTTSPTSPTTILFSPALGTPRHFYTLLAAALASATRATVITIDHPHDAAAVEYPNGTLVAGDDIASSDAQIRLAVATRAQDMRFVLDAFAPPSHLDTFAPPSHPHLRPTACGGAPAPPALAIAIGHSLGGAAALVAAAQDARIAGAVNIDGSVFFSSSSSNTSVVSQKRTLFLAHAGKDLTTDATWGAAWPRLRGWKRLLQLEGAAHYTFSDLPALVEGVFGHGGVPEGVREVVGTVGAGVAGRGVLGVLEAFVGVVGGGGSEEGFGEAVAGLEGIETVV
ncbi:hypothetical protein SLS55_010416, partial [Diplodia seriata]